MKMAHPDRGRRCPWSEPGNQGGGESHHRCRDRDGRHPARLGGPALLQSRQAGAADRMDPPADARRMCAPSTASAAPSCTARAPIPARCGRTSCPTSCVGKYAFSPKGIADCTDHVLRVLDHLEIGALLAIGGDDTLSYALRLHQEKFPVVGIPKTMDNDVFGTDYCIGFSTAVSRSIAFMNDLRTPTGSHERIAVVELFGRNSGETALIAGYLGDVDRTVIPEVPFDPERLAALVMEDKRRNPSNYAIVAVSEGATMIGGRIFETGPEDAYGHRKLGGIGQATGEALKQLTGEEIVQQQLGYLMRSGPPDALDRMVAISYANLAADLAFARTNRQMVALAEGIYTTVPLDLIGTGVRRVDVEQLYDAETYRPKVAHLVGKPMFLY